MSGSNTKSYKYVEKGGDFECSEPVLVEFKGIYYPAKVLKIGIEEEEFYYFIHYVGWNKTRDEWVWKDRILKRTDANLKMSTELNAKAEEGAKQLKRKSSGGKEGSIIIINNKNKSEVEEEPRIVLNPKTDGNLCEVDQNCTKEPLIEKQTEKDGDETLGTMTVREHYVRFPDSLAQVIVEDYLAEKEHKLELEIPAPVLVNDILEDYVRHMEESGGCKLDALGLVVAVKHDFNTLLRSQLLYLSELTQLKKFESKNPIAEPSAVFGAHHLLRLLTIIGHRLKDEFQPEEFQAFMKDLEDLLELMENNFKKYFKPNAETPPGSPLIGSD